VWPRLVSLANKNGNLLWQRSRHLYTDSETPAGDIHPPQALDSFAMNVLSRPL
jgi:hypothetical protein